MKQIKASELKRGDIFTKEMNLRNREAFHVTDNPEDKSYLFVTSRNDIENKERRLNLNKNTTVILLRHLPIY